MAMASADEINAAVKATCFDARHINLLTCRQMPGSAAPGCAAAAATSHQSSRTHQQLALHVSQGFTCITLQTARLVECQRYFAGSASSITGGLGTCKTLTACRTSNHNSYDTELTFSIYVFVMRIKGIQSSAGRSNSSW
jgi:hypothetical protein